MGNQHVAAWGDMAALDAKSLIYDLELDSEFEALENLQIKTMEMIGRPEIHFRAAVYRSDADSGNKNAAQPESVLANWHVRLEDVSPDGFVTHITGASINGAHSHSRIRTTPHQAVSNDEDAELPTYLKNGDFYDLTVRLHYSAWAIVAITYAMFPMVIILCSTSYCTFSCLLSI